MVCPQNGQEAERRLLCGTPKNRCTRRTEHSSTSCSSPRNENKSRSNRSVQVSFFFLTSCAVARYSLATSSPMLLWHSCGNHSSSRCWQIDSERNGAYSSACSNGGSITPPSTDCSAEHWREDRQNTPKTGKSVEQNEIKKSKTKKRLNKQTNEQTNRQTTKTARSSPGR